MLELGRTVKINGLLDEITDLVSKRKFNVTKSINMNGDVSYAIILPSVDGDLHYLSNTLSATSKCGLYFFSSEYSIWYSGVDLMVSNIDARRLFKTMQQVYHKQEREKSDQKVEKLEKALREPVATGPVAPAFPSIHNSP